MLSQPMPKRSSKPRDTNRLAAEIVHDATVEPSLPKDENPEPGDLSSYAKALGRQGGLKGGKARAEKLTPAQRSAIAKKAAKTRWQKPGS
jgi:hypothetical protein